MRLRTLRLVNYRRFRDASLEFPDGLIGIVGRNGAGKSSVVESMLWCLFGHEAARTSKDLLKRQAAAPGEDVVVRLEFEIDGTGFAVQRRLRGKSLQPEASVESGGQVLVAPGANSWDQANQFLVRLLGFDRAAFESTVVAKQGELAALSDLRPAQRKHLLLDMLGVDRVEDAVQACRQDARVLEIRLHEARRGLEEEPGVRAEIASATTERSLATAELERIQRESIQLSDRLAAARTEAERLLESRLRDQDLRLRLQGLQARLENLWSQRTRLAGEIHIIQDREHALAAARANLPSQDDWDARWNAGLAARDSQRRRGELDGRLEEIAAAILRWRPDLDPHAHNGSSPESLTADIERVRRLHDADAAEAARLQAEAAVSAQELQRCSSAEDGLAGLDAKAPCPTCGRALGKALVQVRAGRAAQATLLQARVGELTQAREGANQRVVQHRNRMQATETALHDVRQRIQRAAIATDEVGRLQAEELRLRKELAQLPAALDASAFAALERAKRERDSHLLEVARLEEALARLPKLRDEDRVIHAQERVVVEEREGASRELQRLAYVTGAWERAQEGAEALTRRAEALERQHVQWTERATARARDLERLQIRLSQLHARRAETEVHAGELRLLERLAAQRGEGGLLPQFKSHLVGRIRPALSRAASSLLQAMTQGRYADLVLDEDYGARLYDGGVVHPLERFSGGEVDVANLALRLAVSELVANARGRVRLQFVALDEVFGSQDEGRRGAVLASLSGLSNVFRQVLVVTHLEDVRDRLDHVIRVDEEEGGASRFVTTWDAKP